MVFKVKSRQKYQEKCGNKVTVVVLSCDFFPLIIPILKFLYNQNSFIESENNVPNISFMYS